MIMEHTYAILEETRITNKAILNTNYVSELSITEDMPADNQPAEHGLGLQVVGLGLSDGYNLSRIGPVPPTHCLICNLPFTGTSDMSTSSSPTSLHNVFTHMKSNEARPNHSSKTSVFEKLGQVLGKSLGSINLHSETVCDNCFNLLVSYDEIEIKLGTIRSEMLVKFENTARQHQSMTNFTPMCEDNLVKSRYGPNSSLIATVSKPKLIITDEGKVVDENGKEKETIFNVDTISAKNVSPKSVIKRDKTSHHGLSPSISAKRPYLCPVCGKSFRAFSHRVEHMLIHLGEKPWNCDECKKTFRTKSALKIHSMKHSGARPFVCTDCGKSFADKYYFDEHCRIHSGERPFECSYCIRLFTRKKDLAVHMKMHTGDKPFKCSFCSKTFAVKSRLDRHSRTHSGIKPHSCEFCNKSFSRQDDCKVHVRQHTGERPFCCGFCEKTFTNKSNCLVHVRTHTGSKAFTCYLCNANFDRRCKLEEHMAEIHSRQNKTLHADRAGHESEDKTEPAQSSETLNIQHVNASTNVNMQAISTISQPLLCDDSVDSFSLSEPRSSSMQDIGLPVPIGQVTQLWSEGNTTTFVNIPPGTYVNIITEGNSIINA